MLFENVLICHENVTIQKKYQKDQNDMVSKLKAVAISKDCLKTVLLTTLFWQ